MIQDFYEYLIQEGLSPDIADETSIAIIGLDDVSSELVIKHKLQWMDDKDHDYSGEIVDMFRKWQLAVNEISLEEYRERCKVNWPHLQGHQEQSRMAIYAGMKIDDSG